MIDGSDKLAPSASNAIAIGPALNVPLLAQPSRWENPSKYAHFRYSDAMLLDLIRMVAKEYGNGKITSTLFRRYSPVHLQTVATRFGSWAVAVRKAGVPGIRTRGGMWFLCPLCETPFRSNNGAKARRTCSAKCTSDLKSQRHLKPISTVQAARGRAHRVIKQVRRLICDECGHDGTERKIEIHHIDRNPFNNELSNLRPLCKSCHGRAHWKVITKRPRRPKPPPLDRAKAR